MKRKNDLKLLLTAVCAFSLFSFIFVNTNMHKSQNKNHNSTTLTQGSISQEEEETAKPALPDVKVVEHVLKVAQRFIPGGN